MFEFLGKRRIGFFKSRNPRGTGRLAYFTLPYRKLKELGYEPPGYCLVWFNPEKGILLAKVRKEEPEEKGEEV